MTDTFIATIYNSSKINLIVNTRVAEDGPSWNLIPMRMAIIIFLANIGKRAYKYSCKKRRSTHPSENRAYETSILEPFYGTVPLFSAHETYIHELYGPFTLV